jgi:hypothetical protein
MSKAYPSNLSRDQFELIAAKLPTDSRRGRPAYHQLLGHPQRHLLRPVRRLHLARITGDFPPGKRSTPTSDAGAKTAPGNGYMMNSMPSLVSPSGRHVRVPAS